MTDYLDSRGKRLDEYWRPSITVDTAVLSVRDGVLSVVLVETSGGWRLPGTFLHEGETLADAVRRSLNVKAGIRGLLPQQLHVFDAPGRDDRGHVLSVGHLVAVRPDALPGVHLVPVTDARGLAFDHDEILDLAVQRLREDYRQRPDPAGLLSAEFTLFDLRRLHHAIDPETPQRDTFRRTMEPKLVATGELERGTVGKPARLFRRA